MEGYQSLRDLWPRQKGLFVVEKLTTLTALKNITPGEVCGQTTFMYRLKAVVFLLV